MKHFGHFVDYGQIFIK